MLCVYCAPKLALRRMKQKMHIAYFKSKDLDFRSLQMMHNKPPDKTTGFSLLGGAAQNYERSTNFRTSRN